MRTFLLSDKVTGKILSIMEGGGLLFEVPQSIGNSDVIEITDHDQLERIKEKHGHFKVINKKVHDKTNQEKKAFDDEQAEILKPTTQADPVKDKRLDVLIDYLIKINILPKNFDIKNIK